MLPKGELSPITWVRLGVAQFDIHIADMLNTLWRQQNK